VFRPLLFGDLTVKNYRLSLLCFASAARQLTVNFKSAYLKCEQQLLKSEPALSEGHLAKKIQTKPLI